MSLIIEIKVVVQSGKSQLLIDKSGVFKCFVKSAPEKGKANKEVVDIVSKLLKISKRSIDIVSGFTSRKKLLKINADLIYDDILETLGSGIQKKIF